jgi:hypothetical protein
MIVFARSWLGYPKYGLVCLPPNLEQDCECVCTCVDMYERVSKDPPLLRI